MKKSELLAASMLAASATAVGTTSTITVTAKPPHKAESSEVREDSGKEKMAPRFDGLRFIETLVTAHR